MLARRMAGGATGGPAEAEVEERVAARRAGKETTSTLEQILRSPVTRTVAGAVTRGLLGALLGPPPRRRRNYR